MSAQRWRRRGKLSGPANVLDDRYEIVKRGSRWIIVDHPSGKPPKVIEHAVFRSMRDARAEAEWIALGDRGRR